jgi:adenylate kinase
MVNVLIFGPNGGGKGTQSGILQKKFGMTHCESGALFRKNIKGGTELGNAAKAFIDKGQLVPDSITIPMMLNRLKEDDCKDGWLLDGFPRTEAQAKALVEALAVEGINLDYVIELDLDRAIAKNRLTGRRVCAKDPNHPNHTAFPALMPTKAADGSISCRVCGGALSQRKDDADDGAIEQRHDIYYKDTVAAISYFKSNTSGGWKFVSVDGSKDIAEVTASILAELK